MNKSGFSFIDFILVFIILGFASTFALKPILNYQKETHNNAEKKESIQEYSYNALWQGEFQKLNQATSMILITNNNTLENLCDGNEQNKCMMEKYFQVLSAMSSCHGNVKGKCWHNDSEWFLKDGNISKENVDLASGLILNNGVMVIFKNIDTSCKSGSCGQIIVDVNGFNKPNREGYDIFRVNILKNTLFKIN